MQHSAFYRMTYTTKLAQKNCKKMGSLDLDLGQNHG